jgi:toluene monooxygenase system protein D
VSPDQREAVGPVLEAGEIGDAIIAVLHEQHPDLEVHDRGAYKRVLAPGTCLLRREAVERRLGRPFRLPGDLELVMPAFRGRIFIADDHVVWRAGDA